MMLVYWFIDNLQAAIKWMLRSVQGAASQPPPPLSPPLPLSQYRKRKKKIWLVKKQSCQVFALGNEDMI